eukprot:c2730_g1_i1.p2 GENE.c2730_g1_i1~~c2730_g1_i1.p2  ORF type:complete len:251 (+),score=54.26 c2730_g1_i1:454-1206(+)
MEEERAREEKAPLFKMKKFQKIGPAISSTREPDDPAMAPAASSTRTFLRAGEGGALRERKSAQARAVRSEVDAQTLQEMDAVDASTRSRLKAKRKPGLPGPSAAAPPPRRSRDYVTENARETIARKPAVAAGGGPSPLERGDFGKVPEYLIKRKIAKARQELEDLANAPDPDCPPNARLMPEPERQATVRLLLQNRENVLQQMNKLPLACDTFGLKRQRRLLEEQLAEIDDAVKIFSRAKVFIDLEDAAQ